MEEFTATVFVLVERGGGHLPALASTNDPHITALTELSRLHDAAMAT
jgi:hypothetical protein